MKRHIVRSSATLACVATLLVAGAAKATLVTVDQIIYQSGSGVNPGLISGTVDITSSGSQLTILLRNTSPDAAFTDPSLPANMLLTGLGLQLGGAHITGGSVTVNSGSTAVNFGIGQDTVNIANQWGYANGVVDGFGLAGVLPVNNVVSTIASVGPLRFGVAPPPSIGGPGYGAVSAANIKFGSSQPGVKDTIKFVLNLDGTAPDVSTIDAGSVVLAFGSPDSVPDGGMTLVLLGMSLSGIACFARRHKLAKVS